MNNYIGELDEASKTHAQKYVQAASNRADEFLEGHFRLLAHQRVRQRVVVDRELDQVALFLVLERAYIVRAHAGF